MYYEVGTNQLFPIVEDLRLIEKIIFNLIFWIFLSIYYGALLRINLDLFQLTDIGFSWNLSKKT